MVICIVRLEVIVIIGIIRSREMKVYAGMRTYMHTCTHAQCTHIQKEKGGGEGRKGRKEVVVSGELIIS